MTTSTMTDSQVKRFVRAMEDQDVVVTKTKKGLFLRLPDGGSTTVHFTTSDVRAVPNLIGRLRRAGVRHPDDTKNIDELPAQITEGRVAQKSKEKVLKAMCELDYPSTVRVVHIREMTGQDHVTASRSLYHMGFRPTVGKRNARDWLTPAYILDMKPSREEESPMQIDVTKIVPVRIPEEEIRELEEEQGEGKVQLSNGRELIDTHDSWTVDLSKVPTISVADYVAGLQAAGLSVEIRVWR